MELSLDILRIQSKQEWLDAVMNDFDSFLQDHADCERKASSMALSFVAKYPDRLEIIPELIDTAVEELQHFRQVYRIMEKRGLALAKDMTKDLYVSNLLSHCRSTPNERFVDRLVLASIVEWRGCERFKMIAEALEDKDLKNFYTLLWQSEGRHGEIFTKMAMTYFPETEVNARMDFLLAKEAEILDGLEIKSALH